jgi:hypothetical protein
LITFEDGREVLCDWPNMVYSLRGDIHQFKKVEVKV